MTQLRFLLVALALLAASCGSADTSVIAGPAIDSSQSATTDAGGAASSPSMASVPEDHSAAAAAAITPAELLRQAVSYESDQTFRLTSSAGMEFKAPRAGVNIEAQLDTSRPLLTATQLHTGDLHVYADLGPLMEAFAAGNPALEAATETLGIELWAFDGDMVVDTTDYAELAQVDSSFGLGPFRPGVFSLQSSAFNGASPLMQYMVGAAIPDPAVVARELPLVIDEPQISPDGRTVVGTATFGAVTDALGSDLEITARSAAAGVAPLANIDLDELTEAYLGVYERAETKVDITLPEGDSDAITVRLVVDLSHVIEDVFAEDSPIASSMAADEVAAILNAFDVISVEVEQVMTIESVDVDELPESGIPTEDRTAEMVTFLGLAS